MTKELELKLVEKYPKILGNYDGDMEVTCFHFGFEHGDGWFNLLDKGLDRLQFFARLAGCKVVVDQVKEKMGDLRFYYHTEDCSPLAREIVQCIVSAMERESMHICELTGVRGELCSNGGWLKTLCREEANKIGNYKPVNKHSRDYWEELNKRDEIKSV